MHQTAEVYPCLLYTSQEDSSLDGMGTTFTVAVVLEDQIVVSHVGDTRAYLWREGELSQLTTDHSYVQFLVSKGILTPEEAGIHPYRNIITRALGMEEVIADSYTARIAAGDRVLLCSDGLTTHVNDAQISAVLAKEAVAKQQAEELLALAMSGGGTDNISVIVGKIDGKTEG